VVRDLVGDAPTLDLHGRTLFQTSIVDEGDLRGRDVLDLGCGFGWFTLAALEAGARTALGVEITDEDLATARASIDDPRAAFRVGSALDIPAEDASADTAVAWEVIEHVPRGSEARMLQEIARVLRPGGVLYLSTPFASARGRLLDPAWLLKAHRHYDAEALGHLAAAAGLEVEWTTVRGGWWEAIAVNNLYFCKWVLRRRPLFDEPLQARLDREFAREGGFTNIFARMRRPAG
jgi:SAM-dependent methyltransferase